MRKAWSVWRSKAMAVGAAAACAAALTAAHDAEIAEVSEGLEGGREILRGVACASVVASVELSTRCLPPRCAHKVCLLLAACCLLLAVCCFCACGLGLAWQSRRAHLGEVAVLRGMHGDAMAAMSSEQVARGWSGWGMMGRVGNLHGDLLCSVRKVVDSI